MKLKQQQSSASKKSLQQEAPTNFELSNINEYIASTEPNNNSNYVSSERNHRVKYGKMVVLFQNDRFLLTIGPDYMCFLFALIFFSIIDFFTVKLLYNKQQTFIANFTFGGACLQILSYFAVAISNPGIITQSDFDTQPQQTGKIKRFCSPCNLPMLPRSRHCSTCDVCIKGYDHHCPWTSKCIGEHNLKRFYFFACFTPLFLIYCVIILLVI